MRSLMSAAAAIALATGCATAEQTLEGVPSGAYEMDKTHAMLVWKVSHLGLSTYVSRFTEFDAMLDFNPEDPAASSLSVTVNPASVETDYRGNFKEGHPNSEHDTWNEELGLGDSWLNGDEFPEITFVSTDIETTGDYTGKVTGDLTFLGVTKPVTLDVTYNGTQNMRGRKVGFSATGTIDRTEFGLGTYAPMIGTQVELEIEAEFAPAKDDAGDKEE